MKKKNLVFIALCCLIALVLNGCTAKPNNEQGNQNNIVNPQPNDEQGKENNVYTTNLTKVSTIIQDNVSEDVITAAKTVINSFLQYEKNAKITVSGNTQRFINDMAYVIHCTCPLFDAFTDFNEMTAYDKKTGNVSWNYFIDKDEFNDKLQSFYDTSNKYLSKVNKTDSEAMKAILLYYAIIDDLNYDYDLIGNNYNQLSQEEANMKSSPYYVLTSKSGICTNIAQAYMYLCTQVNIDCGTVLHTGGSGMHMWNIIKIDNKYYYCDPTWDANASLKHFGLTASDRASWAGGYSNDEGSMLSTIIPNKYEISDSRFETMRSKLPIEISDVKADKDTQTIKFLGYEYEYNFECK